MKVIKRVFFVAAFLMLGLTIGKPGLALPSALQTTNTDQLSQDGAWFIERVDDTHYFTNTADRILQTNAQGYPRLAYGGDHLYYAAWDGSQWNIQVADASDYVGEYATLALDSFGYAHIAYYDHDNQRLKYARQVGATTWDVQVVDDNNVPGRWNSIAVDTNGYAHISYLEELWDSLKYARWTGSDWNITTIPDPFSGTYGSYNSLVLDSQDHAHLSYYDGDNYHLNYAYWQGPGDYDWDIQVVDTDNFTGVKTSIDVDDNDHPHISYLNSANSTLRYATFTGTQWITQTVTQIDSRGQTSLRLDNLDVPYISYIDGDEFYGDLRIAYLATAPSTWISQTVAAGSYTAPQYLAFNRLSNQPVVVAASSPMYYIRRSSPTTWENPQEVDANNQVAEYTSLQMDTQGILHISYYDENANAVQYTYQDGNAWVKQQVASDLAHIRTPLALDKNDQDRPYIAYASGNYSSGYSLILTHWQNSQWITQTVDTGFQLGWYPSLAIGSDHKIHLSYYDVWSGDLKYALCTLSLCNTEVVPDTDYGVGLYTSIALDPYDNPHISYYSQYKDFSGMSKDLKYAYKNGGTWTIELVDESVPYYDEAGKYSSIALDNQDYPHISYVYHDDDVNDFLKYAYRDLSGWHTENVILSIDPAQTSLGLDALGQPHISFKGTYYLGYVTKGPAGWREYLLANNLLNPYLGETGEGNSLKLNHNDMPVISYQDEWDLRVALRAFQGFLPVVVK